MVKRLLWNIWKARNSYQSTVKYLSTTHNKMAKSEGTFPHFGTDAIHAGQEPEQWNSKAVVPLISLSTTFAQDYPGNCPGGFDYVRGGNPTRDCMEKCVAAIDGAKYALSFSSGLSCTLSICNLLKSGDHIVCMDDVYGGTNRYFRRILSNMAIETSFTNAVEAENIRKVMTPKTKLVWIETPTNPLLRLVDIQAVADIVHTQPDCILVVDNTFASSYFQRPLDFGADITMHSGTKYMNGHSDVLMGLASMNNKELYERLKFIQFAGGPCPSPFDCYLMNRGIKTLHVRMRQHAKSAMKVAEFLGTNPRVEKVIYPGLPSHPQYELYKRQMKGFGGMVTFRMKGVLENAVTFQQSLKVITLAESLGGYESLIDHPAMMTHQSVPPEQRKELGIDDTLLRLSIGLEDIEDIIADIDQALKKAVPDELL